MLKSVVINTVAPLFLLCAYLVAPAHVLGESNIPSQEQRQDSTKGAAAMDEPVSLDWDIAKDKAGQRLHIKYMIRNKSHERVYILDQLVGTYSGGMRLLPNAMIVNNGGQPETVKFVRGFIRPTHPVIFIYTPAARALEPGAQLEGSADVPLPLAAWQPLGRPRALKSPISKAILEVGYVTGTPEFASSTASDGTKLATPTLAYIEEHQRFVRTMAKLLPVP